MARSLVTGGFDDNWPSPARYFFWFLISRHLGRQYGLVQWLRARKKYFSGNNCCLDRSRVLRGKGGTTLGCGKEAGHLARVCNGSFPRWGLRIGQPGALWAKRGAKNFQLFSWVGLALLDLARRPPLAICWAGEKFPGENQGRPFGRHPLGKRAYWIGGAHKARV